MSYKSEYDTVLKLYQSRIKPMPHCHEWDDIRAFRDWAKMTWSYGMVLRKKDPDGIWSPENAEFVDVAPIPSTERVRMAKQWDMARVRMLFLCQIERARMARQWDVARVRIARMLGVNLAQEKHPCENCSIRETCEKPCEARIDWWDTQMLKIRERLMNDVHGKCD